MFSRDLFCTFSVTDWESPKVSVRARVCEALSETLLPSVSLRCVPVLVETVAVLLSVCPLVEPKEREELTPCVKFCEIASEREMLCELPFVSPRETLLDSPPVKLAPCIAPRFNPVLIPAPTKPATPALTIVPTKPPRLSPVFTPSPMDFPFVFVVLSDSFVPSVLPLVRVDPEDVEEFSPTVFVLLCDKLVPLERASEAPCVVLIP